MNRFFGISFFAVFLFAAGFASAFAVIACDSRKSSSSSSAGGEPGEGSAQSADEKFSAAVPPPDFEFPDIHGKQRSLRDFGGKTVLLNFWATWCVPCVAEMGSLERLYKTYKAKNFEIVAINVDPSENDEAVKKFVRDHGITFPILRDSELSLPPRYGLSGFPETFFIGKSGTFLRFNDPSGGSESIRVVGDRAWDSQTFLKAVGDLLAADQG